MRDDRCCARSSATWLTLGPGGRGRLGRSLVDAVRRMKSPDNSALGHIGHAASPEPPGNAYRFVKPPPAVWLSTDAAVVFVRLNRAWRSILRASSWIATGLAQTNDAGYKAPSLGSCPQVQSGRRPPTVRTTVLSQLEEHRGTDRPRRIRSVGVSCGSCASASSTPDRGKGAGFEP
jgi:hypothetical protein